MTTIWKRKSDGTLLEVRPIGRTSKHHDKTLVRVRRAGCKEWQTWHPDVLRACAEEEGK